MTLLEAYKFAIRWNIRKDKVNSVAFLDTVECFTLVNNKKHKIKSNDKVLKNVSHNSTTHEIINMNSDNEKSIVT